MSRLLLACCWLLAACTVRAEVIAIDNAELAKLAAAGVPVIDICLSGNRTKPVSQFLSQQAGYPKVYNVRDGIRAWAKEGRPMVSAAPTLASCRAAKTC